MNKCDYCKEEAKFTFICPRCGTRLCREHRKPEDHECQKIHEPIQEVEFDVEPLSSYSEQNSDHISNIVEEDSIDVIEQDIPQLPEESLFSEELTIEDIIPDIEVHTFTEETQNTVDMKELDYDQLLEESTQITEPTYEESEETYADLEASDDDEEFDIFDQEEEPIPDYEDTIEEELVEYEYVESKQGVISHLNAIKAPLALIIIGSIISGALMGVLIYPSEDTDNLQQRYDALYQYYTEIQEQNQELNIIIEDLTLELNTLKNDHNFLNEQYTGLDNRWNNLFSDQTEYQAPSLNKINAFIESDSTDQLIISPTFTAVDQAILLSMMAKTQNIRVGIVTIQGNFTAEITDYTYNVVVSNEGIVVYIDPQTDEIWWSESYQEVTKNQFWDIAEYTSVYITDIITIIEH
jgi:hypothetical protein